MDNHKYSVKAKVHNTGNIIWDPIGNFMSNCRVDVTWFPFDVQTCDLEFLSWGYDKTQLNITTDNEISLDMYTGNGEWLIIGMF